ncbi:hypothetical protein OSB04_007323 [Centaurea solstitialis]|uniref:AAA+ ATPase domain-containing protein n=1 Tax=Centaurea solstitialis TaxID=347529 RepID=A0AA38U476_9ASTR|nr:hypothetical protein OSB04_007323 [Centaurea solstitialis]
MAAMANLLSKTPSLILPSKPAKTSRLRFEKPYYTPPSRRTPYVHSVEPISALVKGNLGFVGNMNRIDCSDSGSYLFWNDDQNENKLKCNWRKSDAVADAEDVAPPFTNLQSFTLRQRNNTVARATVVTTTGPPMAYHISYHHQLPENKKHTESKRTNIDRNKRTSGSNLHSKLYTIVVGASFCVVLGLCSLKLPMQHISRTTDVPYSVLVGRVQEGSVTRVQFVENSRKIYFNTKTKSIGDQAVQDPKTVWLARGLVGLGPSKVFFPKWQYRTRNVEDDKYDLLRLLKDKGIMYGSDRALLSEPMRNFLFVFFQVAPFWIMVMLTCYQLRVQHDLSKLTKRKPSKKQSVTFNDVKGVDAAKAELLERNYKESFGGSLNEQLIVLCMKGDKRYTKLGAKLPRGVLLSGPPGTGKTLLARAVAGEAGVSFFSISASELVEVFVGRGAARVRDLFREARKNSPSIIFIDEIDAVGGQRGRTMNCERDQTLNQVTTTFVLIKFQLLTNMDGFEKEESVVVIAATNRPETLDSALMRPGRFSRKVRVDAPDESGRKEIFELYLRDVPMEDDKEAICETVASLTPGFVGADLENIARESVLLAARRGGELVTEDDILEAVDRAKGGAYEYAAPFSFRPTPEDRVPMGFGFSS